MSEVNIEIVVESTGLNNSGAPYEVCLNSNVASKGSIGSTVAAKFAANACEPPETQLLGRCMLMT
jgi:hypothetical protein